MAEDAMSRIIDEFNNAVRQQVNARIQELLKTANIAIVCEPDESPISGHFATEDAEADRKLEREICSRLYRGDVWAWCCVKVVATLPDIEFPTGASHWLGCCSYADEHDFRTAGDYFDDLRSEALDDLRYQLEHLAELLLG